MLNFQLYVNFAYNGNTGDMFVNKIMISLLNKNDDLIFYYYTVDINLFIRENQVRI